MKSLALFVAVAGSALGATCDRACLKTALDQYLTALASHKPAAAPLSINRERFLQRGKDVGVVYDQAAVFSGEDAICSSNRLHERVIAHWFIEINR